MNSTALRLFSLFALALALFAMPSESFAQSGARARLQARMGGVKAIAKYEERGARRKFNFQLELAKPGDVGTVTAVAADGSTVTMGSFTVDSLRRGTIDIDTTEGDVVADLNPGSVVTLTIRGATFKGTLAAR